MKQAPVPSEYSLEGSIGAPKRKKEKVLPSDSIEWIKGKSVSLLYVPKSVPLHILKAKLQEVAKCPGIKVILSPGRVLTKEEFCMNFPKCSMAGDGSVLPGPEDESESWLLPDYANFDHHAKLGEDRTSKKSMCEMVLGGMRHGVLNNFRGRDKKMNLCLFINHLDGDNGLAIAEMALYDDLDDAGRERLRKLSWLEGRTDAFAGLVSEDQKISMEDAMDLKGWVQPITAARAEHGWLLDGMPQEKRLKLLETIISNTFQYAIGTLKPLVLEEDQVRMYKGKGWNFFREVGGEARRAIRRKYGLDPFISERGQAEEGGYLYSVACLTTDPRKLAAFPMQRLFDDLNRLERLPPILSGITLPANWRAVQKVDITDRSKNIWGGDPVGGSFNNGGSRFSWDELCEIVDFLLAKYKAQSELKTQHTILTGIDRYRYRMLTMRGWGTHPEASASSRRVS